MSPAVLASFEAFVVLGIVLGLAAWQWISIRRELRRDRERQRREAAATSAPPG